MHQYSTVQSSTVLHYSYIVASLGLSSRSPDPQTYVLPTVLASPAGNCCKFPKYSDTQNIYCNLSKIWTMRLYHRVMSPNKAPLGAVWSGSALFAQTCLSENLGKLRCIIMDNFISCNWSWSFSKCDYYTSIIVCNERSPRNGWKLFLLSATSNNPPWNWCPLIFYFGVSTAMVNWLTLLKLRSPAHLTTTLPLWPINK